MADDDPSPPPPADPNRNDDSELHVAIREGRDLDVIRSIVERDPQLLRLRRSGFLGHLPLHAAIFHGSPPSVTRYLLREYPESIRECEHNDIMKDLPAHMACRYQRSVRSSDLGTVRLVVEAWPEALHVRNMRGELPLHVSDTLDLIRYVVEKCPEAIHEGDGDGATGLHRAVSRGFGLPVVQYFVERCPELVRTRDHKGRIPLHYISGRTTRLEVVQYLVALDHESPKELDEDGRVPLHDAVRRDDIKEDIVEFLVERAPLSVRVQAKDGTLPLHLAVQHEGHDPGYDPVVVRRLVRAWPESLLVASDKGFLPLHCAAECQSFPLIRFLAGECPESVQAKTGEGWLAVHFVLNLGFSHMNGSEDVQMMYETARFLLDQYPQSVLEPTNEGYLPLHVAAMRGFGFEEEEEDVQMELEFFQDLVRRAPAAVRVASNELLFPFQYAIKQSHLSVPAARFLAEQWPDAVRLRDEEGRTAMHMAVSRDHLRVDYVRLVAELRPQLLVAKDGTGSTPLHVAVAQVQSYFEVSLGSCEEAKYRALVEESLGGLLEIVQYLVEQQPRALAEADCHGSLPLHVAAARVLPALDLVRLLVEARPEALSSADKAGSLPLHVAVALNQPTPALERFLAVECLRDDEALRVARARRGTRSLELVRLLVERSPNSVRQKNGDGRLPLLVAAENDTSLDVLFFLATTWPEAIYGSRRRRHRTVSRHNPDDTLYRTSQRVKLR